VQVKQTSRPGAAITPGKGQTMKHNEWFEGKFLASLKNGQWITEKQVAICKR